eukprot:Pgem_evm8s2062
MIVCIFDRKYPLEFPHETNKVMMFDNNIQEFIWKKIDNISIPTGTIPTGPNPIEFNYYYGIHIPKNAQYIISGDDVKNDLFQSKNKYKSWSDIIHDITIEAILKAGVPYLVYPQFWGKLKKLSASGLPFTPTKNGTLVLDGQPYYWLLASGYLQKNSSITMGIKFLWHDIHFIQTFWGQKFGLVPTT